MASPRASPSQDNEAEPKVSARSRVNSIFSLSFAGPPSAASRSVPVRTKLYKVLSQVKEPIDPQGRLTLCWQLLVLICFLYNCWSIPLRAIFPYQTPDNNYAWFAADYTSDSIYLLDMLIFRPRLRTLVNGFWLVEMNAIRYHYVSSKAFRLDLLSLLPLDLFYLIFGVYPVLRLPRLLKWMIFDEFFDKLDRIAHSPYIVRIVRTMLYMQYLIHLNACAYYGYSAYKGIGINKWVYEGIGNAYIRCYLFSLKTATSIGRNPKPTEESEYIFMTCSWLTGVFVFALLIGQVRDILSTASQVKREYQNLVDRTQAYMHRLHLPKEIEDRVRMWYDYNWHHNNGLDENAVLALLPKKMQSDLALYVHYHTLSKVQLFKGLDHDLLRELVLKLKPVLYLPGDYVCKKGEVGKEMFIVNDGEIEVMGGEHGDIILATLGDGCVFGEISLLALAGGNRRTADVRAKGYSYLFVLNKTCLQETVREYPEAQQVLQMKARKLMQGTAAARKDSTRKASIRKNSMRNESPQPLSPKSETKIASTEDDAPAQVAHGTSPEGQIHTVHSTKVKILAEEVPRPTALVSPEKLPVGASSFQSDVMTTRPESRARFLDTDPDDTKDKRDTRILSASTFNQIVKLMQEPLNVVNEEGHKD